MYVVAVAALVVLTGCADRPVEVPTTRAPAATVTLQRPVRCPSDTVLLDDEDPKSGAGAVPVGFAGQIVLRCEVDHTTMTTRDGVDRFTVRQWQGAVTSELEEALALPDRKFDRRGGAACGGSTGSTTALYVVDATRQAARVLLPTDEPCRELRPEVEALLPDNSSPPSVTFHVSRRRS